MEQTGASMDKAKEWIGDVISRVGTSFRERRTQSVQCRANVASFYNRQNNEWRRHTENDKSSLEQPFLNRLKSYCLNAFKGNTDDESNGMESASNINEDEDASLEEKDVQKTKTARSVRCNVSISITSLEESMLHSYYSSTSRRTSIQTEFVQKTTCEKGKSHGRRLIPLQNDSTDSGLYTDCEESTEEQKIFIDEQCSNSRYWWREGSKEQTKQDETIRECNITESAIANDHKGTSERTETDVEETFSKNYSVFCEKLSSIQKTASTSHDHTGTEMPRSFSYNPVTDPLMKTKVTSNLCDTRTPEGLITISLQHFQKSRQLRIVLHSVESSVEHNRKMFCKVSLKGKKSPQKEKSRKIRSKNGNADIKETFYMNAGEDLNGYILKIQLRTVSRILKRQSVACEAYIALETMDIDLDTTMMVKMRDPKSMKQVQFCFNLSSCLCIINIDK